ncbi:hypothetical protein [uncultured Herbaspirillum sp.]|uniref:hypothetical protein n=1 Tax=uncultured Herbaspirillum sp. TaxID=160236 RepID=UPI00259094E4|nr:hypothetical protein [uncultured Herbaspirillum sp.]
MQKINLAFLRIVKRSEQQDDEVLQNTFVDFGSILTVVTSIDHQVIYGRRGTGKTHLLTKVRQTRKLNGEATVQIDMRNLGSSGGLYADPSIPLAERATRLLVDVVAEIHGQIHEQAVDGELFKLADIGALLSDLFAEHATLKVVGETVIEAGASAESAGTAELKLGVSTSPIPSLTASAGISSTAKDTVTVKKTIKGHEILRVNFGRVGTALRNLVAKLPKRRLWLLIDEWSEVPLDIQPYLADMLRRAVMPVQGMTVKIAAIEQRSQFLLANVQGDHVRHLGLELGSDISSAINLDEFMVFENDETRAIQFFKALVFAHVKSALNAENIRPPKDEAELISWGFTQGAAFDEVVRACEGVPRDAINILSHAAQRAGDDEISIGIVRDAAQQWYQGSKDSAVSAHSNAKALLVWIIDKVIKERQAKAFLLPTGTKNSLIDFLYDERVLHVLRKGISAKDSPGKRFNVYAIDYGCYVDLINTARGPRGLLDLGDAQSADFSWTVPKTDFRSIRRCVLDLEQFYKLVDSAAPGED